MLVCAVCGNPIEGERSHVERIDDDRDEGRPRARFLERRCAELEFVPDHHGGDAEDPLARSRHTIGVPRRNVR